MSDSKKPTEWLAGAVCSCGNAWLSRYQLGFSRSDDGTGVYLTKATSLTALWEKKLEAGRGVAVRCNIYSQGQECRPEWPETPFYLYNLPIFYGP